MHKNIFVLGLTPLHLEELRTIRHADEYEFHDLLDHESLVEDTSFDFDALLERARRELDGFDGSIDAIVSQWDFPTSLLGPLLAAERGLPAPSLRSLLMCEHKYWSRLEQRRAVPDVVPGFAAFDPFADDVAAQIDLDFPYWVKPIKAHSSNLGFRIDGPEDLEEAVRQFRAEITDVGDAFDQALARVDVPDEVAAVGGGSTCLAEAIIEGIQFAPEGSVSGGEFSVHGTVDMHKDESGLSIERLDYPARTVPQHVQEQAIATTETLLHHIGFDDGCFNAEYMWDEQREVLRLIEVNTRISQSHSVLFALVDGRSNHQVAVDVALGRRPSMPEDRGDLDVAAWYRITHDDDAVVRSVPDAGDIEGVEQRWPGTRIALKVEPGDQLSRLLHQDSYRYLLADVYVGAPDVDALAKRIEDIERRLPFDLEPVDDERSA